MPQLTPELPAASFPPTAFKITSDDEYCTVVHRDHRRLHAAAFGILRNREEAEDAIQEAHLRALVHLDQFAGRAPLVSWVKRITINQALTQLRRRVPSVDPDDLNIRSMARDPEQEAIRVQLGRFIAAAIESLPPKYRSVFLLRELQDLDTAGAAACLGITAECVKTRLHRAKALLRKRLREDLGPVMSPDSAQC